MKASQFFVSTLKEAPADAEVEGGERLFLELRDRASVANRRALAAAEIPVEVAGGERAPIGAKRQRGDRRTAGRRCGQPMRGPRPGVGGK